MGFNLDDYATVDERINKFYEVYPEGRLVTAEYEVKQTMSGDTYVAVRALAYRNPEDNHPANGLAWEVVPGKTSFTKGSELMNAETSAWGRAIVALGPPFATKKIASREEVVLRQSEADVPDTPLSVAGQLRKIGMKGDAIKMWLITEGGFEGDSWDGTPVEELKGAKLAEFLNSSVVEDKAGELLEWAKGK